jgi:hypothetical protein
MFNCLLETLWPRVEKVPRPGPTSFYFVCGGGGGGANSVIERHKFRRSKCDSLNILRYSFCCLSVAKRNQMNYGTI